MYKIYHIFETSEKNEAVRGIFSISLIEIEALKENEGSGWCTANSTPTTVFDVEKRDKCHPKEEDTFHNHTLDPSSFRSFFIFLEYSIDYYFQKHISN